MRICPRCRSTYAEETDFCGIDGERLIEQAIDPLIGERIDRYEFVERLGGGAMGVVYRARHTELDRHFAIKVLYGEIGANKSLVGRFRREARAVSRISHPNIIGVVDFGTTDNGLNFLVMENVIGETLADTLEREGVLAAERAAGITAQVAAGLGAAHALGFVHRDVKPANIMLAGQAGQERVKVLDFGIVGIAGGHLTTKLTGTGRIVGTPRYMSPEQARDSGVGPPADLYSLGVMLYEMLSGEVPFPGDVMADVLVLHSTTQPPPLPPHRGLESIALWLLEKRPEDRPPDATAVIEAIADCFPDLTLNVSESNGPTSHPSVPVLDPFDEDQIPTARPAPADSEILEAPDLVAEAESKAPVRDSEASPENLYDSGPDLVPPRFEELRPTSDFDPAPLYTPRSNPTAAIFSTLGTASDQLPAPAGVERSWWGRHGPLIGVISLLLSVTALAIVIMILRTEDPFDSDSEIAMKLQRAEMRARIAETKAKEAFERAQQAETTAKKLVETATTAQVQAAESKHPAPPPLHPKKKRDPLAAGERDLRRALRERGLTHADLELIPATRKLAARWLELRDHDRPEAATVVAELIVQTRSADITNHLLWKKYARITKDLAELAKADPKTAAPIEATKRQLKKQLNQRRLPQQKRESIGRALTDLENEVAAAKPKSR